MLRRPQAPRITHRVGRFQAQGLDQEGAVSFPEGSVPGHSVQAGWPSFSCCSKNTQQKKAGRR